MVTKAIAGVWLISIVAFLSIWISQTHALMLTPYFLVLPFVMLAGSFVVFRNLPLRVRRVHHAVVGTALIVGVVAPVWMILYGGALAGVGALFLVFSLGAGYVPFIAVIAAWSAVSRGRGGKETLTIKN